MIESCRNFARSQPVATTLIVTNYLGHLGAALAIIAFLGSRQVIPMATIAVNSLVITGGVCIALYLMAVPFLHCTECNTIRKKVVARERGHVGNSFSPSPPALNNPK